MVGTIANVLRIMNAQRILSWAQSRLARQSLGLSGYVRNASEQSIAAAKQTDRNQMTREHRAARAYQRCQLQTPEISPGVRLIGGCTTRLRSAKIQTANRQTRHFTCGQKAFRGISTWHAAPLAKGGRNSWNLCRLRILAVWLDTITIGRMIILPWA